MTGIGQVAAWQGKRTIEASQLLLDKKLRGNVSFKYYPSGHMIYLNPEALHQLHTDLAHFYDETVAASAQNRPAGR